MKSMRSNRGKGKNALDDSKHYFAIMPVLLNVIAIAVFIGAYCYIVKNNLFSDYLNYIYWTVNILVSYNILVASARSLWVPLFSLLIGAAGIFLANATTTLPVVTFLTLLTVAQCWQLAILGIIGLLITFALRL